MTPMSAMESVAQVLASAGARTPSDRCVVQDMREVIAEATALADDSTENHADRLLSARELVGSVLPVLKVRRFDAAHFSDGRLLLILDGVPFVLSHPNALLLADVLIGWRGTP